MHEIEEHDVVYARPEGIDLAATVYRPRAAGAVPLPALVDVHGGAWTKFDRTADAGHCRALAASGLVVVALDFRQGPAHRFPTSAADVAAGVRWVRAHTSRLGVDPRRIGLLGSSSGGHLALLVAIKPGAPEHAGTPIVGPDGRLDDAPGDASVACVLALYPVADPIARYRYALTRQHEPVAPWGFNPAGLVASHRAYFTDEAQMEAASVTRALKAGEATALPPAWIAQPELDDNVPAAITDALVEAYGRAGGRIERVLFPGARHSFMGKSEPDTDKCLALMRGFIGRNL